MSTRSLIVAFVICAACSVASFMLSRVDRGDADPTAWEQAGLAVDGATTQAAVAVFAVFAVPVVAG